MKSIYSHRGYVTSFSCPNTAARWLEQTATGHTVFLNGGHVLHTQIHLRNFKIIRSSKHIYVEKNAQNMLM